MITTFSTRVLYNLVLDGQLVIDLLKVTYKTLIYFVR